MAELSAACVVARTSDDVGQMDKNLGRYDKFKGKNFVSCSYGGPIRGIL
jgi:hypothetical protein